MLRVRQILGLASAAVVTWQAGRQYLNRRVDESRDRAIAEATEQVRATLRDRTDKYLRASFSTFWRVTLIKALILFGLASWYMVPGVAPVAITVLIALFLIAMSARDLYNIYPLLSLGLRELQRHQWRPRTALKETIIAQVFENVLVEAEAVPLKRHHAVVMRLAGRDRSSVTREIADAVARLAGESSWGDIRPFLLSAVFKFAVVFALYGAFVTLLMRAHQG